MGFHSSVNLYRPGPPPARVTGLDLARFVARFATLGVHRDPERAPGRYSHVQAKLRFGNRINRNKRPAFFFVPTALQRVLKPGEIRWDAERGDIWSLDELGAWLATHDAPLYRASLTLGSLHQEKLADLRWVEQVKGEWNGFSPDTWSLNIEPLIYEDQQQRKHHLGWMDISFSGNGYFFPCRPKDVIDQVRVHPHVAPLENNCRELWPVKAARPSRRDLAARGEMATKGSWPYETIDRPLDWCWGAIGCGA